jgi:hypothetical protein
VKEKEKQNEKAQNPSSPISWAGGFLIKH